ncbi:hypothetical protein YEP4_12426 [Yersinia enterocolitica subsp. palearctica YE-P4]|uniref:hypothetical protein n=1 Tax=Yersinia enterocolitica TaxID=630 RepID=UPI00022DD21F|nr:hypothetical protein IOK_16089 [Yersinia enterocolitica subsp. palearctica PhRBD_Ye1]EKN3788424.1 hypothetical protein [Yersinia enterocolitica]EOR67441.1 hypothetical protein YE149_12526 [Yersinia enterocolitica subsp. palearctica YE-149]EOR75598.1 hypothetical protein YE150_12479 [Yersinia enterocolitica subsp. palearctica YE-150]EOR76291.1 hypothetical protein YEP1_12536 [Yersinia enterocolitica subsp. palearctica YE-P1]EOR80841.1 hypothetical protein YEP4_12426 [Yersinia enterocolitica 
MNKMIAKIQCIPVHMNQNSKSPVIVMSAEDFNTIEEFKFWLSGLYANNRPCPQSVNAGKFLNASSVMMRNVYLSKRTNVDVSHHRKLITLVQPAIHFTDSERHIDCPISFATYRAQFQFLFACPIIIPYLLG